jgi:hypothetical protein
MQGVCSIPCFVASVKTPPYRSPGAGIQTIIERREWNAVVSDKMAYDRRSRLFLIQGIHAGY